MKYPSFGSAFLVGWWVGWVELLVVGLGVPSLPLGGAAFLLSFCVVLPPFFSFAWSFVSFSPVGWCCLASSSFWSWCLLPPPPCGAAVYISWPMLLVAQSSSVERLVVLVRVRSLWWNMGIQLGRSQPRAGLVGKHTRDRTSLSQTSYLPKVRGKGKQESQLLSRHVSEIKRGLLE